MSTAKQDVELLKEYVDTRNNDVDGFLRDVMSFMLSKDQDTLTMVLLVDNTDGSKSEIELDVRIVQITQKGA